MEQKLGISAAKYTGLSVNVVRGDRDKGIFVEHSGFPKHIYKARALSVVLYDVKAQRGWLVDGASALLHLVRTQVVHGPGPYGGVNSLFNKAGEKFAHPSIDAGPNAARDLLLDNNTLKHVVLEEFLSYADERAVASNWETRSPAIVTAAGGSTVVANAAGKEPNAAAGTRKELYKITTMRDLIADAWGILEQIHNRQEEFAKDHTKAELPSGWYKLGLGPKHLEGYEFQDIVCGQGILTRRKIELHTNGKAWAGFTGRINSVVLFGSDFGEVYKVATTSSSAPCKTCETVPQGHEYLAVPISLLKEIQVRSRNQGLMRPGSQDIVQGFRLRTSKKTFIPCPDRGCGPMSQRVQEFTDRKDGEQHTEIGALTETNGAIFFGKINLPGGPSTQYQHLSPARDDLDRDSGIGSSGQDTSEASVTADVSVGSNLEGKAKVLPDELATPVVVPVAPGPVVQSTDEGLKARERQGAIQVNAAAVPLSRRISKEVSSTSPGANLDAQHTESVGEARSRKQEKSGKSKDSTGGQAQNPESRRTGRFRRRLKALFRSTRDQV